MDTDLKIKIKKRGSLKCSLTIFTNYVNDLLNKEDLSQLDMIQLQGRLEKIENIWLDFDNIQTEIESLVDETGFHSQFKERENFENNFNSITAHAKLILESNRSHVERNSSRNSNDGDRQSEINSIHSINRLSGIKLPVIQLPKFSGEHSNWLEFRDTFQSLIHDNEMITNMQKYHYLKASLEGTAAQIIKAVEFSTTGYILAWDVLCERYNNKKLLVYNHVKNLFSLESIQKECSFNLRKIVDEVSRNLRSLQTLEQPIDKWDTLLVFIVTSKLDMNSLRGWENHTSVLQDLPSWADLKQFLSSRAEVLETIESKNSDYKQQFKHHKESRNSRSLVAINNKNVNAQNNNLKCNYCKESHTIYNCSQFLKIPVTERVQFVKNSKLCNNCLRTGHFNEIKRCSSGPCRKCKGWHNTLLHVEPNKNLTNPVSEVLEEASTSLNSIQGSSSHPMPKLVLLSTVCVTVVDSLGTHCPARAILDSGSQSSFITSSFLHKLGLPVKVVNIPLHGIGNSASTITKKCRIKAFSKCSPFSFNLDCFVIPEITGSIPPAQFDSSGITIPPNIKLADPSFYLPSQIDVLIGADLFWSLLDSGRIILGRDMPVVQETKLGWVVSGPLGCPVLERTYCNFVTNDELNKTLSQFWDLEEIPVSKLMSSEELRCEKHFVETTKRDSSGRFIVSIPLSKTASSLGDSRNLAIKKFLNLEKRLSKNNIMKERYSSFMDEYLKLGHMSKVLDSSNPLQHYYMPHHGVLKEESTTTKLRVVFNASSPSSSGISLNDIQLVGPQLQDDLMSIVLRFRKYAYVLSADITKMYRQILVDESQRGLQRIVWRFKPTEPLKYYTLNTVTYGQASSSYLAIRCLFELANECEKDLPDVAEVIRHDFYVDDLLTGADSIQDASALCTNISNTLLQGCFELRKWHSNEKSILSNLDHSQLSPDHLLEIGDAKSKTLGLTWNCSRDRLCFQAIPPPLSNTMTKRTVLSHMSKIFDPLGLIGPFTILSKIFMQTIWLEKLSWDDPLPDHLTQNWSRIQGNVMLLNEISIPRHAILRNAREVQLHGFSDASERAYGACIYLRSLDDEKNVFVSLLCSKSKVAPLKRLSIPRLELCAAHLLSKLVKKVNDSLKMNFDSIFLWSDSTITLSWIRISPNLLQTFVGNRVSEIQVLTKTCIWRHVPSQLNPADQVSRGIYVKDLAESSHWWHGPDFLTLNDSSWPKIVSPLSNLPEVRVSETNCLVSTNVQSFIFKRFSDFSRLKRIVAHILRFRFNCFNPSSKLTGKLSTQEINDVITVLVKQAQNESFCSEIKSLSKGEPINSKSKILALSPFLDQNNLLRVGGRLKNSEFAFEKKHPLLLNGKHTISELIFREEHVKLMHAGPQQLLYSVRETFWVTSGRNLARNTVRKCLVCFRQKPQQVTPIMGQLPSDRLRIASPFQVTGVDYAGPMLIKDRPGRGSKVSKCYVAIFVCFSTKAIHIEVVSDLSSQAFLSAFRRFISRRGKPSDVYSDNGSNFVGAYKELGKFLTQASGDISSSVVNEGIQWHFQPPYSPHFGGLWEAGVKSVKFHLKRIASNVKLTFEELTTIMTQIEAILNSRPLTPLSPDPNDLSPLTPAHFLVFKPLVAAPDRRYDYPPVNKLNRFSLQQSMIQHFWSRWSLEYVSQLQQRVRWKSNEGQLQEGNLVLIKEDNTLPTDWRLGRIVKIHHGRDGQGRVATIQTQRGAVKRSFPKICPLPTSN